MERIKETLTHPVSITITIGISLVCVLFYLIIKDEYKPNCNQYKQSTIHETMWPYECWKEFKW